MIFVSSRLVTELCVSLSGPPKGLFDTEKEARGVYYEL
jgi:hypothetical protein